MTRDERFLAGIEKLGLHVEPGLDTSAGEEYVVVSYDRSGTLYGDDAPCLEFRRWQLIYLAPVACNRSHIRNKLRSLIYELFEGWPREEDVSDASGQRFLYEFSSFGDFDYGPD